METGRQRGRRHRVCLRYRATAVSDYRAGKPPALPGAFGAEQVCWVRGVGSLEEAFEVRLKVAFVPQNEFADSILLEEEPQ